MNENRTYDWFSEAYEDEQTNAFGDRSEQRLYDYELKRETLESFTKWITTLYGPDVITNKHIEQWLKDNS